jgi:hypothetical protein
MDNNSVSDSEVGSRSINDRIKNVKSASEIDTSVRAGIDNGRGNSNIYKGETNFKTTMNNSIYGLKEIGFKMA